VDVQWRRAREACRAALGSVLLIAAFAASAQEKPPPASAPPPPAMQPLPASKPLNPALVELGRHLFFDPRLSGDTGRSCATCHDPAKGLGDGKALSTAYTGSEYFRNSPPLYNLRHRVRFLWDGRLDGSDAGTLVRDMVTEAHFMNADGRLVQERLKQVPEYVALWEAAFGKGSDPYGPRMFNAVGAFMQSIESANVPFDRWANGDKSALSADAQAGHALFHGKARCSGCHHGPVGSDGKLHRTGVPEHPDVLANPLRTITMLRHYATSGRPNYMAARTDVGAFAITKDRRDIGRFLTPPLRELAHTAPYMHNGAFATLDEVIDFYDRGGGGGELQPLALSADDKRVLRAFLMSLSGDPISVQAPKRHDYALRALGRN
jgi:cytochrome c peroxidase